MTPLLQTIDLNKSFGAIVAAAAVNVSIHDRAVVGIIGSNGAGKTTFINMVTGYLRPTSGTILLAGTDITSRHPIEIVRLGVGRSFQVAQLFGGLTAYENVLLSVGVADRQTHGMLSQLDIPSRADICRKVLRDFGIDSYFDHPIRSMPQGARKLLDIAMALATRPRLLLLDEPTSGVSTQEKTALMETILSVVRNMGITVVLIEHDMDVVEHYTDRVLAFAQGGIFREGPTCEVLHDPAVRKLIIGE
jgi:branched-chain amino acid transport system ATP-binding protein